MGDSVIDISFEALLAAIGRMTVSISPGTRLTIPFIPTPFVAPPLRMPAEGGTGDLGAEVLFIQASAAVGKSTTAAYLAGTLRVPLLDLARVPVSTGSLKALLLDVDGVGDPLKAFHEGDLPVIVDALDEGRLHSGEASFESFLLTTGELLNERRTVTNRPKLIIFGRYEAIALAELGILAASDAITSKTLEVGFFGEAAARELIDAYAKLTAKPNAAYRQHPGPAREVIQAYFDAIESALGLSPGSLWSSDQGKAFAGYAPVLAAVGSLLAEMDNFTDVINKLKTSATHEAWDVIESVLGEIIQREQRKVTQQLAPQISVRLPPEVYDSDEQLALLSKYVHGQPLQASRRAGLTPADQAKYQSMAQLHIPDHPFVRNREFGNAVLGSEVIAHAIIHDLLGSTDLDRAAAYSRQPFLWRAFVHRLSENSLIDGRYIGYILNSLWNDSALSGRTKAVVSSSTQETVSIIVGAADGKQRSVQFAATLPLTFYGQIKDCDLDVEGATRLVGHGPRTGALFFVRGDTSVVSSAIELAMDSIRFDGKAWLEAEEISSPPQLNVHIDGAKVGWGGQFRERYPWSGLSATLSDPRVLVEGSVFRSLIQECERRIPLGVTPILNPNLSPAEDDPHMRWVRRRYSEQFPILMGLAIKHSLGSSEPIPASGQGKVRMKFTVPWSDVLNAMDNSSSNPQLQPFIKEAQEAIGE